MKWMTALASPLWVPVLVIASLKLYWALTVFAALGLTELTTNSRSYAAQHGIHPGAGIAMFAGLAIGPVVAAVMTAVISVWYYRLSKRQQYRAAAALLLLHVAGGVVLFYFIRSAGT